AFLDRTVDRSLELAEGFAGARATDFRGGWSEYEDARRRERERHSREYDRYAAERGRIAEQERRMQRWEERGYGQGRKKKKTKDVKKAYEKKLGNLAAVDKPYEPWELQLAFAPGTRSGDVVLRLERAVARRGDSALGRPDLDVHW